MLYHWVISILLSVLIFGQSQAQINKRMKRFLGTWEYESIKGFEVWRANGNELSGSGYRIKNGVDTVLIETMRVTSEGKKLVYYARVTNQNDGQEIRFEESKKLRYKFVNETHDFPKSIYYQFKMFKRKKVRILLNHPHKNTHSKPIIMVRKKD